MAQATSFLKVSKSRKQFMMSKLLQKKRTKLTILSKEDGQDSGIRSLFGRSFDKKWLIFDTEY